MPSGGARARSGPTKDPKSRTSERAGYVLTSLPREGYREDPPDLREFIPRPNSRHRAHWAQLWTTPQACAWSSEPWRWPQLARLVRLLVRAEMSDAPAAIYSETVRLETKHGLSDDGLRYLGWAIAPAPPPTPEAVADPADPAAADEVSQRRTRRLRGD